MATFLSFGDVPGSHQSGALDLNVCTTVRSGSVRFGLAQIAGSVGTAKSPFGKRPASDD
jgi:hypothetical protein